MNLHRNRNYSKWTMRKRLKKSIELISINFVKLQVAQDICNWTYQKKGEGKHLKREEISTDNFPILIKLHPTDPRISTKLKHKKFKNEENYTKAYQNQHFKTSDKERSLKAARGKMTYCLQRYKNYCRVFVRNDES